MQPELTLPTSGIHHDIHEPSYHADPLSISSTDAKTLIYKGPDAYAAKRQEERTYNPAFSIGSVVHALVLGVGDYEVLFFENWRTKKSKEARDEVVAAGGTPILYRDFQMAEAMRDSVYAHPAAERMLSEGAPEVSMWATDPATGVLMRGRTDWLSDLNVDLKTSGRPVDQEGFMGTVWDYGYAFQAAWYEHILALNGLEVSTAWIAVTKREPYETGVFVPDKGIMDQSRRDVRRALTLYAHCKEHDVWPSLEEAWRVPGVGAPRLTDSLRYVESVTPV